MVGIAHRHHADAALFGLVDGNLHGIARHELPHGGVAVYHGRHGRFKHGFRFGADAHEAAVDVLAVHFQPLRAVCVYAAEVGSHQHIGNLRRFFRHEAVCLEGGFGKRA